VGLSRRRGRVLRTGRGAGKDAPRLALQEPAPPFCPQADAGADVGEAAALARVNDEGAQRLVGGDGGEDAARGVVDMHGVLLGDGDDADDDRRVGHGAGGDDLLGVGAQDARGGVDFSVVAEARVGWLPLPLTSAPAFSLALGRGRPGEME